MQCLSQLISSFTTTETVFYRPQMSCPMQFPQFLKSQLLLVSRCPVSGNSFITSTQRTRLLTAHLKMHSIRTRKDLDFNLRRKETSGWFIKSKSIQIL